MNQHPILDYYINESKYFQTFIEIIDKKRDNVMDIYQEAYIHISKINLYERFPDTINLPIGLIINFLKGCLRNIRLGYYAKMYNGHSAGAKGWVELDKATLENSRVELLPFEEFETDNDMKALVKKFKELFPQVQGLYQITHRKLKCLTNGKVYNSIQDAADDLKIGRSTVDNALKPRSDNKQGFQRKYDFCYIEDFPEKRVFNTRQAKENAFDLFRKKNADGLIEFKKKHGVGYL